MRKKIVILLTLIMVNVGLMSSETFAAAYHEEMKDGWLFFHEQFVANTSDSMGTPIHINLPVEFDELNLDIETYGTFIKTVTIPENMVQQQMGIELPFVYSAATIFIDGEQLKEVGKIGTNKHEHETNLQTVIVPFVPASSTVEIAIQISSFDHIRGGFSSAPIIGDWETIEQNFLLERYVIIFIGTINLIVGLATLTIGLMNRNEKMFLTFGMFAIVVAIRGAVEVPFLYHELPFSLSYVLATRVEYITTTVCFALYAIFIYLLYNNLFSKWVLYFNVFVLLSIALLSTFTEPKFFQSVFFGVFPFMLFFVFYNIWIMFKALKLKLKLAKSLLLGILFVFVGLIVDFLSGMGVINVPPFASFMIMLNVLLVLFSLCRNYAKQVTKLTDLNSELDELVKERTAQLHHANEELKKLVNTDALTRINNRHKFDEAICANFEKAIQENDCLSLIMLDIDEFKKYNDYYGHVYGDELLIRVAQLIKHVLPEDVIFARYGGEEFAIILPKYSLQETKEIAEKIRHTIEEERIENLGRSYGIVTVSIGCAERMVDQIDNEIELIKISDERLYMSKAQGRNRVTAGSNEMTKI